MTTFEVVFWICIGLSVPILIGIFAAFLSGRYRTGWATLRVYVLCVVVYAAVLEGTSAIAVPYQVLGVSDTMYDGDWGVGVNSVRRTPHDLDEDYEIDLRLMNRGKKPIAGDPRLIAFLQQEDGTRYDGMAEPGMPPLSTTVGPGKTVFTTFKYSLPTNLNRVRFNVAYKGFHLGQLIIGRTPFDGRTVIQITQ